MLQFTLAESELKIYVRSEEDEKSKFEALKQTFDNVQATLKERSEQIGVLKKKIPATEKSLKGATEELSTLKNEEIKLITQIRKERSILEEKRNSMQASRSRGKVLDSLMTQKREGKCHGLYGRLVSDFFCKNFFGWIFLTFISSLTVV